MRKMHRHFCMPGCAYRWARGLERRFQHAPSMQWLVSCLVSQSRWNPVAPWLQIDGYQAVHQIGVVDGVILIDPLGDIDQIVKVAEELGLQLPGTSKCQKQINDKQAEQK